VAPIIQIEKLSYVYPDGTRALRNVNLEIERGEIFGIIGPNGAGKSTLLLHLNGLLKPTCGKVIVDGLEVNSKNLRKVREIVGLVFQNPDDQLFCPTLWEDITFGAINLGLSPSEVKRRACAALKAVGLERHRNKSPHHLSFGQKKRAAIATVLPMRPKILAMDEPAAELDPRARGVMLRIVREQISKDTTAVIATHDIDLVAELCDRICLLNRGRVIKIGPKGEVLRRAELLYRIGLGLPTVARLFWKARKRRGKDLPLTIEEGAKELRKA
jgi:cobalt/nickel transport system ATP-binding protein